MAVAMVNYIEDAVGNMLSSSVTRCSVSVCVCLHVCLPNRKDVCRAECSGSIKKEPNKFKSHSEGNNMFFKHD